MKEVNEIGIRALVTALGKDDARRFLAQFRNDGAQRSDAETDTADELPSLTIDQAHETIRDMHDPMEQQHML